MYLLHPGMNITEVMICEHLYWPNIRDATLKEVSNCETYQITKQANKNYGKLPAKLAEGNPWNKICADTIEPYAIRRKGNI